MHQPPWALAQYLTPDIRSPRLGVLADDRVLALPDGWPTTAIELFDAWDERSAALRALDPAALRPVADAELVAPVTFPRKLICASANYADHAAEMGAAPTTPPVPSFFLKPPTTSIVGPDAAVGVTDAAEIGLDWEVELAVVIGRGGKRIRAEDAASHIAGYTVANDLSARNLFHRKDAFAPPFVWDWYSHKALDDLCPLGPGVVPAWFIVDPEDLGLRLTVNGVVKQNASTSSLVTGIAELIAAASAHVTLEPGDVILTGTPAGVGMSRGEYLSPGDDVVAEIEQIGRLRTMIVADPAE